MSIKAEIIADSLNPVGKRLTTFILEYPRFIHAEIMTHRMFSKNAASSRAIPIEKMIQQVIDNPAMPVWWGKNQSGMQAKEELDDNNRKEFYSETSNPHVVKLDGYETPMQYCKNTWLEARDVAIKFVRRLDQAGLHKQIANRILEPWFNIRVILSGTDFENFFALRAHPDAQPEFQALAYKMLECYNNSTPKQLNAGEWHIPFGDKMDVDRIADMIVKPAMGSIEDGNRFNEQFQSLKIKIAVARCARVSYFNFEGKDDYRKDIEICDKLFGSIPRHLSPAEHVAVAYNNNTYTGNFCGFRQYRKVFDNDNLKDNRIIRK